MNRYAARITKSHHAIWHRARLNGFRGRCLGSGADPGCGPMPRNRSLLTARYKNAARRTRKIPSHQLNRDLGIMTRSKFGFETGNGLMPSRATVITTCRLQACESPRIRLHASLFAVFAFLAV